MSGWRIGVDIGGSFVDALIADAEGVRATLKLPLHAAGAAASVEAVVAGLIAQLGLAADTPLVVHYGTTLATNALLEHRLPPIALIVTHGFRELLETSGVHDEDHHEPSGGEPAHRHRLVELEHVHEITGRLEHDGRERTSLDPAAIDALARRLAASGPTVVAVSLLHSWRNPAHEREVRDIFARIAPASTLVLSSDVLSELREYERTVVTCLNAALLPLMRTHLAQLAAGIRAPLWLMKSSGGLSPAATALAQPLATALSGPSAAVVGSAALARALGIEAAISLDVGGTSTDVALIHHGRYAVTTAAEIDGHPVKTPALDVLSIGAGGGSIARLGADRRWHVGPASAGAMPGPVCYGQGGVQPTLTDAHCVLGRLPPALLDGALPLDVARAQAALAAFGAARGLDATQSALGVLRIATHAMCGAVRRVCVRRGHDPRAHTLFALGGAGPLHAAELAALLGIPTVIVPLRPGLAAAEGLLHAEHREDGVQTFPAREDALDAAAIDAAFAALEARVAATAGATDPAWRLERSADLRYTGMSAELTVPFTAGAVTTATLAAALDGFHAQYALANGQSYRGREQVELVNLRVAAIRPAAAPPRAPWRVTGSPQPCSNRTVHFLDEAAAIDTPVYRRDALPAGTTLVGPLVIEQPDSTTLVPPACTVEVDDWGNLHLNVPRVRAAASPIRED